MSRQVYMDNAATTRLSDEVLDSMMPYFKENYGNASSIYSLGGISKVAVEESREIIAEKLGAKKKEIFFTSGGSESDNWAIKGIAEAYKSKGNHIITSKIEHHAVLHTCEYLEKKGYEVSYLDVDEYGTVDLDQLKSSIRDETILISIMFANNEIGTIQPIKEIGKIAKEKNIVFHTDAVQAIGNIKIDVNEFNIDMMSFSGHKIHAQKGIGGIYIRSGIRIPNLIHGGGQERGKRAGTENVAAIVGLAKAFEVAYENFDERTNYIKGLRDKLIKGVLGSIEDSRLNGHPENRLVNNTNFCFKYIEGESLLLMLDMEGIQGSSGSACTSGSLDPSHVLLSIGLPHEIAHGSLRLSLSEYNTEEEIDYVIEKLKPIVQRLRDMSPLYYRAQGE
ncbi:MAG: cysteine desulfurase NifS [Tissierellia bacterium]|nr:cysteine desulfurase NifS [Tissierellia bacterium]